jgi:hypothetical protein
VSGALYLKIFGPLLKIFFRRSPPPPPRRQKNFRSVYHFGSQKIFPRFLFIVIPYNRINLNHDRINLNLVGAPNYRGPLVLELTLTTVRYATDNTAAHVVNSTYTPDAIRQRDTIF